MLGNASSLERIVPSELHPGEVTGLETLALHVARYRFSSRFAQPGRLLDIACGAGYGTALLADAHRAVECVGVDVAESAISHARLHYARPNTRYVVGDAMHYGVGERFETIVSLETIEHLPDPAAFIARVAGLLAHGGHIVASVPITPSVDANPHHHTDFTERTFRALFRAHGLSEIDHLLQVQRYSPLAVLARREARTQQVRHNLLQYYARHPSSFIKRVASTLRHGFTNRYLTIAWQRTD